MCPVLQCQGSVEYKDFWAAGSVFREQEISAGSFIGISGTTSGNFEDLPEIFKNKYKVPELPEILDYTNKQCLKQTPKFSWGP